MQRQCGVFKQTLLLGNLGFNALKYWACGVMRLKKDGLCKSAKTSNNYQGELLFCGSWFRSVNIMHRYLLKNIQTEFAWCKAPTRDDMLIPMAEFSNKSGSSF